MTAHALALALILLAPPPSPDPGVLGLVKSKVSDPAKPFVLVVTLKVKSGQEAALAEAYRAALAGTKAEPGYLAYELTRSPDEPAAYVLYEKWKSLDALAAHLAAPHTVTFLQQISASTEGVDLQVRVPVE